MRPAAVTALPPEHVYHFDNRRSMAEVLTGRLGDGPVLAPAFRSRRWPWPSRSPICCAAAAAAAWRMTAAGQGPSFRREGLLRRR
jgi:hypothetical protein